VKSGDQSGSKSKSGAVETLESGGQSKRADFEHGGPFMSNKNSRNAGNFVGANQSSDRQTDGDRHNRDNTKGAEDSIEESPARRGEKSLSPTMRDPQIRSFKKEPRNDTQNSS
jgi:hypothetical protein